MEENEKQKNDEMLRKEMLKKVDKKKLKKLIAMCFKIKDCEILGLDKLLDRWSKEKLELYKILGNELKIEKDICLSKEKIKEMVKESKLDETGLLNCWNNEFDIFLENVRNLSPIIYSSLDSNFNFGRLREQIPDVNCNVMSSYYWDRYFKTASEKMNFSTLMHKIYLSDELDKIVSKLIQKVGTDLKGKMYISIDPFDYVTMSLNRSRWSSCHSLHSCQGNGVDVGCYSAGIFSYMCDDVSLIAYKTDGEEYKYEFNGRSFMAESKNWRQMVFIHPDNSYFICSRQYPYSSEIITKIIREMIEEKIDNMKEVEEDKTIFEETTNTWKISRKTYDNKNLIYNNGFEGIDIDEQEGGYDIDTEVLHYNDMLHGFNYQLIYKDKYKKSTLSKIGIGCNPECPVCGENILSEHNSPMCYSCREYYDYDFS